MSLPEMLTHVSAERCNPGRLLSGGQIHQAEMRLSVSDFAFIALCYLALAGRSPQERDHACDEEKSADDVRSAGLLRSFEGDCWRGIGHFRCRGAGSWYIMRTTGVLTGELGDNRAELGRVVPLAGLNLVPLFP